jgi:uncharacterized membrane protein YfcA
MNLYLYLVIGLLVFLGFTVRVITGFGSTMLIAPLLTFLLEPKQVVVFVILLESAIGVLFALKEQLTFTLKPMFLGGVLGILTGIFLFGIVTQRLVGLVIGVSVLIFSILFLMNVTFRTERERPLFAALGFLSGSMGVLTGINGPQIVLGLVNQGYDGNFVRRCMISYLLVVDLVTLASFCIAGYVAANLLLLLVFALPFLVLAYLAGAYILLVIDQEHLKRAILMTTLLAGLLAVWKFVP